MLTLEALPIDSYPDSTELDFSEGRLLNYYRLTTDMHKRIAFGTGLAEELIGQQRHLTHIYGVELAREVMLRSYQDAQLELMVGELDEFPSELEVLQAANTALTWRCKVRTGQKLLTPYWG